MSATRADCLLNTNESPQIITSMKRYDLTIIGASFAGLTCAEAATSRGLRTGVFDRKKEPGASVRTTGIIVKEVADRFEIPRRLTRKIHGVRLYSPNLKSVDLFSPGYYFLATDTPNLLREMTKRVESLGAEFHWDYSYEPSLQNTCRYLVGCDGANSEVARDFGLGRNRFFLRGLEWEFCGIKGIEEDLLHVFLDSSIAPGYIAWVVPGVGITQVGLAVHHPHIPRIESLIDRLKTFFDFSGARIIACRGGLIPCGGIVKPWYKKNVCLLGDAAGMVSPLTGGGIHPAMEMGHAAGVAISDYLLDSGLEPGKALYPHIPKFTSKTILRNVYSAVPPPNWFFNLILGNHAFQKAAKVIFYHHRGLLSLNTWKELLKPERSMTHSR